MSAAARRVDQLLHQVSTEAPFLLELTPTNVEKAWAAFSRARCRGQPRFTYRPLSPLLREHHDRLQRLPLEEVHDPGVRELLVEQRDWQLLRLSMLDVRERPRFLEMSRSLYGDVDDNLLHLAQGLLMALDEPRGGTSLEHADWMDAKEMRAAALALARRYQGETGDTETRCQISEEVEGLVVNQGTLHISPTFRSLRGRKQALLAHEVGTHVLTYLNAAQQPLWILRCGLAGYDELQEGLAVVSEYVVGGLSKDRMRLLAARVISVRAMLEGASFEDVFHLLYDTAELSDRACFVTTMRVFRGGGFTKDAAYLRGLRAVLKYLGTGGDLAPLLVGKIGLQHIPVIDLLLADGVLEPPRVIPLHFTSERYQPRVKALHEGLTVMDLIERSPS